MDVAVLYAIARRFRFARWFGIISQAFGAIPGVFAFALLPTIVNPNVIPIQAYIILGIWTFIEIVAVFLLVSNDAKTYFQIHTFNHTASDKATRPDTLL